MEYAKPIFKDTSYNVELVSCSEDIIVNYDETLYTINLFNMTFLKKDSVNKMCEYLSNANNIVMEVDLLGRVNHSIDAYLFIDNELLQTRLISEGYAKVSINNPEYKYHDLMIYSEKEVNAKMIEDESMHYYDRQHGNNIIIMMFIISVILVLINGAIFFRTKKKSIH